MLTAYRRDALLKAAIRVFGEWGFDSATMERIAQEADVAKGTTYLYYRSKQTIYDAALGSGLAELGARTQAAMERAAHVRDAITAFMTTRAAYFCEHRDFFRMYVAALARHITGANVKPSELQSLIDRQIRGLERAIARAIARREIRRVDPAATALAIFDITRGVVARRITSAGSRDVTADVQFLSDLIWQGLEKEAGKGKKGKEKGKGRKRMRGTTMVSAALGALLTFAAAAAAQTQTPNNPFLGSAPQGAATAEPLPLSLKDAVERALHYNLGLLLQEESAQAAHGARWRALTGLLPNVSAATTEARQVINLDAYGFPGEPSIIGPFNVFDARVYLSQPIVDLRAVNDARAAAANERAEKLGVRSARDLVTLVAVNLYLEAVAASSRIEAARAQQNTAEAVFTQTSDMKQSGVVAGIDVLRAQVQLQNQRQRTIRAENEFEKAKLQLARAIGLPSGQRVTLTDRIPYAPLADVAVESALKTAFDNRADYLAARERLAAAEASRRAAADDHLPTVHVDADYGAIGQTPSDAHPTFRVAATLRIPIFDAGRSTGRRLESEAELNRRRAELEDFRGRVEYDVRAALLDLRAAAQQLEAAQSTFTLAGQELEQARDRYAAGVAGSLEVTQAQETVAAASETLIGALYTHNLAKASLARAVGTAEQSVMSFLGGSR